MRRENARHDITKVPRGAAARPIGFGGGRTAIERAELLMSPAIGDGVGRGEATIPGEGDVDEESPAKPGKLGGGVVGPECCTGGGAVGFGVVGGGGRFCP